MVASPPSVPPVPRAVVCDLDGTLVDTVPTRITAWLRTFAEFAVPADREHVAFLIGSDGKWLAERVAERAGRALVPDEAEAVDRRAGAIYGDLNVDPQPLPGVGAFLDAVAAAGLPWAVATSSRPEQVRASVAALRRPTEPLVVDGHAVARAKPEPDLLLAAAKQLATPPNECWCVGDSRWDMLAAVAAGMTPVGVTTGSANAEELQTAGAIRIVDRLDELVDALRAPVPT
jgi:phosphoglycolate phosphatase-like HAD superfamily hydrolase